MRALAVSMLVLLGATGCGSVVIRSTVRSPNSASPVVAPPVACTLRAVSVSIAPPVPGDLVDLMTTRAAELQFRNNASAPCALRGWPTVVLVGPGDTPAEATVVESTLNTVSTVPTTTLTLRAGESVLATLTAPTELDSCTVAPFAEVTLPGDDAPIELANPGGGDGFPCVNAPGYISPFFTLASLQRALYAFTHPPTPPGLRTSGKTAPPACTPATLKGRVNGGSTSADGKTIVLKLTSSATCNLGNPFPTVRANAKGGATQVAKARFSRDAVAGSAAVTEQFSGDPAGYKTVTVRPKQPIIITMTPSPSPAPCSDVTSFIVYPSGIALGTGIDVNLTTPIRICSTLSVAQFTPAK